MADRPLTAELLRWRPGRGLTRDGIDRERARTAAFHAVKAAEYLMIIRRQELHGLRSSTALRGGLEHARLARGFLGAIGFESGTRLYAPAEPA